MVEPRNRPVGKKAPIKKATGVAKKKTGSESDTGGEAGGSTMPKRKVMRGQKAGAKNVTSINKTGSHKTGSHKTGAHKTGRGTNSGTIAGDTTVGYRGAGQSRRVKIGLALKFTLPVAGVVALILAMLAIFVAKSLTNSLSNEILKSGISQVSMLAAYGKVMINKSESLTWPVDLGLMSKEKFDELKKSYTPPPSLDKLSPNLSYQRTLYAALRGGLLTSFITYHNKTGEDATQVTVAYVVSKTFRKVYWDDGASQSSEWPKEYLLARSEPGNVIPDKKQSSLLIDNARWVPKYVNLVDYSLDDKTVQFGSPEMPCVVNDMMIRIDKVDYEILVFSTPIYDNGEEIGTAILGLRAGEIISSVNALYIILWIIGTVGVLLAVSTCFVIGYFVTRPIKALISDMNVVAGGNLEHKTRAHTRDEIGLIAMEFNDMTKQLLAASKKEKEAARLENELEMACEIQMKLLPPRLPKIKGFDIFATYHPAKEVGGDYYDFFPIDKRHVGIIVADVSGKGIPGSMVMATTRTILRFVAGGNLSSADTLSKTNAMVAADIKRGMFVTAFYLVLDVLDRKLLCSSAGHNPMVLHHADDSIELINPNGIALGFDKGRIFSRTIKEQQIDLRAGDRVVLYTDGVVESMNINNEEYTDERFYEFVKAHATLDSEQFVNALLADLNRHKGKAEQHDDITVVTFRVL